MGCNIREQEHNKNKKTEINNMVVDRAERKY